VHAVALDRVLLDLLVGHRLVLQVARPDHPLRDRVAAAERDEKRRQRDRQRSGSSQPSGHSSSFVGRWGTTRGVPKRLCTERIAAWSGFVLFPPAPWATAMRFYEFESRRIVERAGIPVTEYGFCKTGAEARNAAERIGRPTVIKSQVLTGGR